MWMGTLNGAIIVFHIPTLKRKFTCMLKEEEREMKSILDILYVQEKKTVLVTSFDGEIWYFDEHVMNDGLKMMQPKVELTRCYHMVKVSSARAKPQL